MIKITKDRSILTKDTKKRIVETSTGQLSREGRRKYDMNTNYKYMKQSTGQLSREKMEGLRSSVHGRKQTW